MKQLNPNTFLKFAVIASLFCHILMINSIEFTFGRKAGEEDSVFSKVFFLGSILEGIDYNSKIENLSRPKSPTKKMIKSHNDAEDPHCYTSRLDARYFANMIRVKSSPIYDLGLLYRNQNFDKSVLNTTEGMPRGSLPLVNLTEDKATYFKSTPLLKTKKTDSSLMFYPPMPYHFLLYFKDRQTAHMEVAFYISSKSKVVGMKRMISSGNPEVDLLIMRNLNHFLNICKSNLKLGSWQTVKVDLSP